MGGGRAITTAAKMAGIGVARGGLRGAAPPAADQFRVMNASVSKQASASITSSVHTAAEEDVTVLHRPAWEFDDWEFAGFEEEVVKPSGGGGNHEPIARVVFSGPPTLEEAKEATEELKETIGVYLSSPKSEDSIGSGPVSGMLRSFQSSENRVSKGVDSGAYPVPQVAMQAFSFLSESPAAQSVVVSIASDPKVWGAVMENKDLMKFLESNNTDAASSQGECDDAHSTAAKPEVNKEKPMEFLDNILQDMKLKVVQLMENVSSYFGGLFGFGSNSGTNTEDGKSKATFFNDPRTLFGLAVVVIFMVVLKRA